MTLPNEFRVTPDPALNFSHKQRRYACCLCAC